VIGIGPFTSRVEAVAAKEAFATGDRKRHNHTIADLQVFHLGTDLDNLAHVLMAKDVAAFHRRNDPAIDVQVGAAYGAGGHLDNRISPVFDLRVRNFFATDVALAVPS
jgi:hypothetical protein